MSAWHRRLFFLLMTAFCVPSAQAAVFYPETFTLANGLQVVVVTNRLSPAVAQMVWYKVGSADEPAGKSGLAHFLEHLMFKGTPSVPAGAFSQHIASFGGTDNAFTSHDYTAYHEIAPVEQLSTIMQLEADRMQNLSLTEGVVKPELDVVLNERHERTDNTPEGLFRERVRHALFPNHPYGLPVVGERNEIEKATTSDATEFYRAHYAPNNAVVIVSGNVNASEVLRLATATFGRVPHCDLAPRSLLNNAVPLKHAVVLSDARVKQAQVEITMLASSYASQDKNEAYALEVLQEVLDGGEVGLLYTSLVKRQRLASGIATDYEPRARGPALFSIAATPQQGVKTSVLKAALDRDVHKLAKTGVDEGDVRLAKDRMRRSAIFARDSLMAPGFAFGTALATGQTVADVEAWPDRINAVTVADVNQALKNLVAGKRHVVGFLLPEKGEQGETP